MSPTLTTTQPATTLNGLDTRKMVETVGALRANPTLARFEFRARNRWISGGENRSTIKDFYGAEPKTCRATSVRVHQWRTAGAPGRQ